MKLQGLKQELSLIWMSSPGSKAKLIKNLWLLSSKKNIYSAKDKISGVVDVHQDSSFLYTEPESCIGFWFALEDATKENGCLWAMPGGHKTTLRSWFRKKEGGGTESVILDETPISTEGMIPLEVKKGSCIVLNGLLPHYSLPNTSGKSRQAYAIHTINKNADYPEKNWLQRDLSELKGFN